MDRRRGTAGDRPDDSDAEDRVNRCATAYLRDAVEPSVSAVGWTIGSGPAVSAGRGVVATKDYAEGDVILVDAPLIVSPRTLTGVAESPVCPVCYVAPGLAATGSCAGGCGLPVCSDRCSNDPAHADECRYVRRLRPKTDGSRWSAAVYNAVTAIRGLAVNGGAHKSFLDLLQKKFTDKPTVEVEELKKNISMKLEEEDEQIMTITCKIMDANCFETIITRNNKLISLKGLYPVASFMNHCCVPNTMHNFNEKLQMIVKASLPIYKGQEITTTYTHLLWSTSLRQNHLLTSKQFICTCYRCCDAEEFGTELAALNCTVKNCSGRVLPVNPLNKFSVWQCKECHKLVTSVEITSLLKKLCPLMNSIQQCPKRFETILKTFNIYRNSTFVVDLRLKFIWKSKNNNLSLEELLYKEKSCVEVLNIVQKLGLGQCRLLGLISLELLKVIEEKIDRFRWKTKTLNIFKEQISNLYKISVSVLDGDANTSITKKP
ncbi:SET domain-containing protein SmydA-8-like [Sipha flava]|uniref:SET domain-containing protein SmydA-8-like n=2 Tax=Sipha flava TaxID=143950 RepID=A0A8B8FEH2_9HEMI|nr:SET domain-containing protein SmydA-8-like [Sipha flava]